MKKNLTTENLNATYYYPIPDTKNTYEPKTEAQRNYLARKIAKTEAVKRAIRYTPELREIIYKLEEKTYKSFLKAGKLDSKEIPYTSVKFKDGEISRKDLDDYIKFIYKGRIQK